MVGLQNLGETLGPRKWQGAYLDSVEDLGDQHEFARVTRTTTEVLETEDDLDELSDDVDSEIHANAEMEAATCVRRGLSGLVSTLA